MNKVIVIADSTADLSPELVEKYKVRVVPLHVTFPKEGVDYLDGVTITPQQLYDKVKELGETPKSGAINIQEFIDYFKPYIDDGCDIIFTGIGSGLSSTINNATVASMEFPEGRIEIVDSQNLSTGTGLLVLKMCELRDKGMDVHEIAEEVRKFVPLVNSKFCINTLDYLYKGGRCNSLTRWASSVFQLHPVIVVKDNGMSVGKVLIGKYAKAVDVQIQKFVKDLPNMDTSHVFVTDSDCMNGEDKQIIDALSKYIPLENIHHTHAGCVVCTHCGPKTIGILYILKTAEK